jgi:hypothetical protein
MAQSAMGEVLTHHGVKGMKWGVRKDHSGSGQSQAMKLVLLGNLSTLSPAFNRYTSTRTHILATLFGPMALTDGAVRADLKQASHKVSLAKADMKWNHALKSGEAYVAVTTWPPSTSTSTSTR